MIVCSCNVLTDRDVKGAIESSLRPRTPSAVYKCLGCSPSCGRCLTTVRAILNETLTEVAAGEESACALYEAGAAGLCPV
ncbi:MAG: (2Fe-2S)-binding protein [Beijerinckiaceae bacterium]|nr:(2Fe-2S)-binding protein [Beijerinckiaceae bacterium]